MTRIPRIFRPVKFNATVHGNPTGLLIANPNANILYSTLAKGPKLSREDQLNSSRQFFRELNRFGITSVIDAGGGFQTTRTITAL